MSGGQRGRAGRKPKAHEEEEHENAERWAVSYADMMTVLLGLFIVLYAMSQVDQAKFDALRSSLAAGFGHASPSILTGQAGPMVADADTAIIPRLAAGLGPSKVDGKSGASSTGTEDADAAKALATAQARDEYARLHRIALRVQHALEGRHVADKVQFRITERGLVIGLVADDVFFSPARANLTPMALKVIDAAAPVVRSLPDEISVEGHANSIPVSGRYPTNWELSADRATQVLRRLVEHGHVPAGRIAAVGFGEARPLKDTAGVDPLVANRRVDLVVLSGLPEAVRLLLPTIAAEAAAKESHP